MVRKSLNVNEHINEHYYVYWRTLTIPLLAFASGRKRQTEIMGFIAELSLTLVTFRIQ